MFVVIPQCAHQEAFGDTINQCGDFTFYIYVYIYTHIYIYTRTNLHPERKEILHPAVITDQTE
jgi:hypothetical protein